jgi:hypothetical protein
MAGAGCSSLLEVREVGKKDGGPGGLGQKRSRPKERTRTEVQTAFLSLLEFFFSLNSKQQP